MSHAPKTRDHGPALLGIALLVAAAPAAAVEPLDTFSVRLGGYVSRFDMEVRADGELMNGTNVDLHHDLGLDPGNPLAFLSATWRPFDRHEFGLSYYRDDVEGSRRLERDIVFDDKVYQAAATVHAGYDFSALQAYYVWWAASREKWAVGPQVGLTWYRMDIDLALELDVNGNPVVEGGLTSEATADLPAITLGLSWRWVPADQWRISAEAGYFSTQINDIDADAFYGRAGVEWFPWERTGFSLFYTRNNIRGHIERTAYTGNLDLRNSGVSLGLVYRF